MPITRLFFDFEDYYLCFLETDERRAELSGLITRCVVWKAATPGFMDQGAPSFNGFAINTHSGLTTYIPQADFPYLNQEYEKLEWTKAACALP